MQADCGLRFVLSHATMRSNSQRPGKAVRVFFVTRMRYCRIDEPRRRFGNPIRIFACPHKFGNHPGMFAIDREFPL